MHHEMLTQRALFCIDVMAKRVTLSQHFVTRVVPPLVCASASQTVRYPMMDNACDAISYLNGACALYPSTPNWP
jgi:hypothetical protein